MLQARWEMRAGQILRARGRRWGLPGRSAADETQIPFGNDKQKHNCNGNGERRGSYVRKGTQRKAKADADSLRE